VSILEDDLVDENNYVYLERYKNYFSNREITITDINNLI
jgi:hypothetical protein